MCQEMFDINLKHKQRAENMYNKNENNGKNVNVCVAWMSMYFNEKEWMCGVHIRYKLTILFFLLLFSTS